MKLGIIEISKGEYDLVVNAATKYGNAFVNAHDLVMFSWNFINRVKPDALAFILFLSQFQKAITLSFLSVLRNHEVQFSLMLRQALEASALAGYALYNPNIDDFGKPNADDCLFANRNVRGKAYKWIEKEYPTHSQSMKYMKDQINESYAHANILPASDNIQCELKTIGSIFVDKPDTLFAMQHLWWIGNVIIGVLDFLEQTIISHPLVTLVPDFQEKMGQFARENTQIKMELKANPRLSRWISKI